MKTRLHLIPIYFLAFTLGLLSAALFPIFVLDANAQSAQPGASYTPKAQPSGVPQGKAPVGYRLGEVIGSWDLPEGYRYSAIEAWVKTGETHGMPYILGAPVNSVNEGGIFLAQDGSGGMGFGNYISAPSLRMNQVGFDPVENVLGNDLKRNADGSPLIIGASTSSRTSGTALESTIWRLDITGTALLPEGLGFVGASGGSILTGGNSTDGYSGGNSVFAGYVSPSGGGQELPFSPPAFGFTSDLDGDTIVGQASSKGFFFNKTQSGDWIQGNLQLPDWSDGTGTVSDVIGNIMGGYLYNPNIDDVVPVLWNTDGRINKIFDLPGYNVTELIEDGGSVVALLNQGEGGNVFGESRLYAEGWTDSRLIYGDILPALTEGMTGTVRDISAGGSLYLLSKITDANGVHFEVADLLSTSHLAGDYDRNGTVDGNDYHEWQQQFGNAVTPWSNADGNGNGQIDAADYVVWRHNFGQTTAYGSSLAVPEPGLTAMWLCVFGMSLAFAARRGRP